MGFSKIVADRSVVSREFARFELRFAECISAAAIKTRFSHHVNEGLEVWYSIRGTYFLILSCKCSRGIVRSKIER